MKSIFKSKNFLLLSLLTIFGGLLRFWKLDLFPVSPNWDEVSHGVNAYSILMTGKDEWGKSFPHIFRAFGDFKLPVYIYLSTIPIWFFGLDVFAVRFVSALAGTLAIPGIYFLARELFLNTTKKDVFKHIPLFSALLITISPWHFFISRPALEANLSLTLIIFGFYFLLRFFNSDKKGGNSSLITSVILLGLSLHTYNTARIFVPILTISLFLIYRSSLRLIRVGPVTIVTSVLLTLAFSLLVVFQVFAGEGTARYEKLKILSPAAVFQIGEKRAQSTLHPAISRLIHNRPVFFITTAAKNYLSYFSPSFFSQKWGAQYQFAIPNVNLLTIPVLIFALVGFIFYLSSLHERNFQFLYAWLFLSPIASALTLDPPQALRPNPMIPALIIFASLGFIKLLESIYPKFRVMVCTLLIFWVFISFSTYLKNYFIEYSQKYSSSWQYGYSEVMSYVKDHGSEFKNIFITKRYGEPHIFYAFYSSLSPDILQNGNGTIRFPKSDWFWTDKIDNVYFVNDWQIPTTTVSELPLEFGISIPTSRSLLVTSPDHVPVNAHIIKSVNFLDGTPAFIITSVP